MATLADVSRLACRLPDVSETERRGSLVWSVRDKAFAWERPFSKADIKRYGDQPPPDGPILAIRTADLGEKEALLAAHPDTHFTIQHFDGFAAILIQLQRIDRAALREALVDGWLARAPDPLAEAYLAKRRR